MNARAPSPRHLVLFDGNCGFCDHAVQFLLDRDRDGRLSFAPLQGETAAGVRARHPDMPADLDSLVYVQVDEAGQERVYWYSRAAVRIGRQLPGLWGALSWVAWTMPWFLRDLAYRAFARVRYRIFGTVDACRIPTPGERERFLP
ncbi:MAG: DUF393 domain-containing protein [Alphaproteobacteria bacterium]|nr:DUF393 domain-containing protein [Alphaproteobacteria bacterium]